MISTSFKKIIWKTIKVTCYIAIVLLAAFRFALVVSKNKDKTINKYKTYYSMAMAWLKVLEDGHSLCSYLMERGIYNVAVYGGQDAGWHLVKQLRGTDITIKYIIDKSIFSGRVNMLPIYRPSDILPEVDAVIVTPVWDYIQIKQQLSAQIKCPIISLEEVIGGVADA